MGMTNAGVMRIAIIVGTLCCVHVCALVVAVLARRPGLGHLSSGLLAGGCLYTVLSAAQPGMTTVAGLVSLGVATVSGILSRRLSAGVDRLH